MNRLTAWLICLGLVVVLAFGAWACFRQSMIESIAMIFAEQEARSEFGWLSYGWVSQACEAVLRKRADELARLHKHQSMRWKVLGIGAVLVGFAPLIVVICGGAGRDP